MCHESFLNSEVFLNAAGAAVGGFLGVLLLFLVKWLIEIVCNQPKAIATYQCASDINRGQAGEVEGELKHHHGKRVDNPNELAKLKINNPVWEWTRDRAGDNPFQGPGGSLFYGPYTTDFTEPGLYSIVFRIQGRGFTKPAEITNDVNLLKLDVNCILSEIVGLPQGVASVNKHEEASRRFVRVSELARSGWQEFELRICSNGRGTWEYRVWTYDGASLLPDNFEKLDKDVRILFDNVIIKKIGKANLPSI